MVLLALAIGPRNSIFSTSLHAQTAPSGVANPEIDKETGKPIITTPSGLKYIDLVIGTGPLVKTGDHVSVDYVGKLIDGTKFDASADHGSNFDYVQGVTSLIAGWTEGTSTMRVGGERKLIIPPQLGYGQEGAGDAVPPNATLIFDIKLISINPS
jgi:peptidylprolyl isomerase